ncbi:MAG: hypothetical protein ACPG4K_06855 [Haloferula sp.]
MSSSPRYSTLFVTTLVLFASIPPGWSEDLKNQGSIETIPEPATGLLGLLGICLILLRRTKP